MKSYPSVRSFVLATVLAAPVATLAPQAAGAQTLPLATPTPAPTPTPSTDPQRPLASLSGTVVPSRGSIRTFSGDLSPYWGSIRTFWGDINPFEGDVAAFWGSIRTFTEDGEQDQLAPNWGSIRTFWGDVGASWGSIRTFWGSIRTFEETPGDYATLAGQLDAMIDETELFWGDAVAASTGKSFSAGFADPMLAKYGIDLSDPSSLQRLDAEQRERFFLDWYDGLMNFSGADHVDHWMKQVSWSPKLTQAQGSGSDAVIGLVDFYAAKDPDVTAKMVYSGGYVNEISNHGAGVLSLIVASHDGKGVMGIAPNARVAAFNPFDASGTASWADVKRGIIEVSKRGAAVVNLSLGVPGSTFHPEWRNVFKDSGVNSLKDRTLYVIAAGNDGISQTTNVEMGGAFDSTFIVVGSVDPSGKISDFSNRPGNACLTDGGQCKNPAAWSRLDSLFDTSDYLKNSGLLMNRFIVAPGEYILVSDGKGGVQRLSGTSFAAPLVAGTVALIHDRWPWLKKYPRDVAKAILESATDLGAPGPDPVYGMGMLNVEAAQSALDFEKLKYYLYDGNKKTEIKVATLKSGGIQSAWTTKNLYFSAFEELDQSHRDFLIPLTDRLVGTTKGGEYFQQFVYNRFIAWLGGTASVTAGAAPYARGFSDLRSTPMLTNVDGWSFAMTGRLVNTTPAAGYFSPQLRSTVQVESPSGKFGFSFGHGDGAVFVGGDRAFQMTSDFDPYSGGVNPLLGFASGGSHFSTRVALSPDVHVSAGVTERRRGLGDDLRDVQDPFDRGLIRKLNRYAASAANVKVEYSPAHWLAVSASMTRLEEEDALLGVRSLEASDLAGGTITEGASVSADLSLGSGVSLFGTATGARSHSAGRDAAMRIGSGGMLGTAFQVGMAKAGVLGKSDHVRLSVAQPLTIEAGTIDMQMVRVVDRETGEIGVVTESVDIGAPERRRFVAELTYGTPVLDGRGMLSLFGRSELKPVDAGTPRLMLGTQARLAF